MTPPKEATNKLPHDPRVPGAGAGAGGAGAGGGGGSGPAVQGALNAASAASAASGKKTRELVEDTGGNVDDKLRRVDHKGHGGFKVQALQTLQRVSSVPLRCLTNPFWGVWGLGVRGLGFRGVDDDMDARASLWKTHAAKNGMSATSSGPNPAKSPIPR